MTRMMLGRGESSTGKVIFMCPYMEKRYRPAMKNSRHILKAYLIPVLFPLTDVSTDVIIPVMDCHISPAEVSDQVKNLSRIKPADQKAFHLAYFRSYQCTSL